jgi:uncharacterized protein (DUF4213/DUF364 family)
MVMKILDDLILSLKQNDFPVKSVHTCVFWTAVISGHCGLSSTFRGEGPSHEKGVRDVGSLTQKTALELAEYARSDSLLEASIGMATINSLIVEPIGPEHSVDEIAEKIVIGRDMNPCYSGAMRRIPGPGSQLECLGMIREYRLDFFCGRAIGHG